MSFHSEIIGTGSYVPPKIITNKDLEALMNTSDEWIRQRSGIEERRWVEDDVCTTDLALEACNKAIKSAGIAKEEIDMILLATITPDHEFPGSSCFLQAKLGLPGITALDIRQACSGFIYGLSIADKFIRSGSHKTILLVGAEIHSKGLDKSPEGRDVGVLFGDGAAAVVMRRAENIDPQKDSHVICTNLHADGNFAKELWLPGPGFAMGAERVTHAMIDEKLHYPKMNGKLVFMHAIRRMSETLVHSVKESGYELEDVDMFLFHQANLRINQKVAETLGLPEEKVFNVIEKYGNTTAATIPLCMDEAIKAGKLKKGMLVASAAFGSGFTWASGVWRL